ncbi:MAG: hypothetical protein C6H99_05875 [Epsilonproteobacteria bacterium]|nr:hypothetical protein [Campylobacterota bacterium]NPA63964.1 hypothetical protein [Campylobacterota bacterium]
MIVYCEDEAILRALRPVCHFVRSEVDCDEIEELAPDVIVACKRAAKRVKECGYDGLLVEIGSRIVVYCQNEKRAEFEWSEEKLKEILQNYFLYILDPMYLSFFDENELKKIVDMAQIVYPTAIIVNTQNYFFEIFVDNGEIKIYEGKVHDQNISKELFLEKLTNEKSKPFGGCMVVE